jgi:hypothetical protein
MAIKTLPKKTSATTLIKTIKHEQRQKDSLELLKIFKEVTGLKPVVWGTSIIGFGSYHYTYASGQGGDWPLVAFSPRAAGITIYIMPGFSEYADMLSKLGTHKISGGSCLYIQKLEGVHIPTLKKLIKQSVMHMKKKYASR